MAARKSGVSWRHLGQLLAEDSDALQRAFAEFHANTDWPWAGQTQPDIELLLAEDGPDV